MGTINTEDLQLFGVRSFHQANSRLAVIKGAEIQFITLVVQDEG